MTQEHMMTLLQQKPELMQELMGHIIPMLMQQPEILLTSTPEVNSTEQSATQENPYLFASMQLQDFANIIGLPNTTTCFEYLEQVETDDIVSWDQFVKIPE